MSSRALEDRLCTLTGRRRCVLTGRGATAIYSVLRALGKPSGKVVFPTVLCPSPANAALYAGLEPLFCDVRSDDFTLDPNRLEELLQVHRDVVAVVAVHTYGHPCALEAIADCCRRRGILIIEDAAQCLPGPAGSMADCTILSFGKTKVLEAGGGGALLTDDEELAAEAQRWCENLPIAAPVGQVEQEYRRVYYQLAELVELNPSLNSLYYTLPEVYKELYLKAFDTALATPIMGLLARGGEIADTRRRNAELYRRRLASHPRVRLPMVASDSVLWRFTCLVPPEWQKRLSESLRLQGCDVSNWYPCLHPRFPSGAAQPPESFRVATQVASSVMNFWLDPATPASRISSTCECLLRELENIGSDCRVPA